MKYLIELGVDAQRIKTISYGKERPLDPGMMKELGQRIGKTTLSLRSSVNVVIRRSID